MKPTCSAQLKDTDDYKLKSHLSRNIKTKFQQSNVLSPTANLYGKSEFGKTAC